MWYRPDRPPPTVRDHQTLVLRPTWIHSRPVRRRSTLDCARMSFGLQLWLSRLPTCQLRLQSMMQSADRVLQAMQVRVKKEWWPTTKLSKLLHRLFFGTEWGLWSWRQLLQSHIRRREGASRSWWCGCTCRTTVAFVEICGRAPATCAAWSVSTCCEKSERPFNT